MARKTKSQKIIAELRRKIKATHLETRVILPQKPKNNLEVVPEIKEIPKTKSVTFAYDFNLIKKDLLKTFFLMVAIISLELILYWTFELNGNRILQNLLPKKIF